MSDSGRLERAIKIRNNQGFPIAAITSPSIPGDVEVWRRYGFTDDQAADWSRWGFSVWASRGWVVSGVSDHEAFLYTLWGLPNANAYSTLVRLLGHQPTKQDVLDSVYCMTTLNRHGFEVSFDEAAQWTCAGWFMDGVIECYRHGVPFDYAEKQCEDGVEMVRDIVKNWQETPKE